MRVSSKSLCVIAGFAVAITVCSCGSGGGSIGALEKNVLSDFQEKMNTDEAYKKYEMTVQKVNLVPVSSHVHEGTATVLIDDKKFLKGSGAHEVPIIVKGDKARFIWEGKDGAFDFLKALIKCGTFTDSRDGQAYSYVEIGGKAWMAKNLNYETDNSWCYSNDNSNCAMYGRLYDWNTAMKACPSGWHLPSDTEWTELTNAVGGNSTAGTKLKSTSGWYNNGNGTDEYGFSALPGGYRYSNGHFVNIGNDGNWWSATVYGAMRARYRGMDYDYAGVHKDWFYESNAFSVRCVSDL